MNEIANPLIGATGDRETLENAAEALSAALELLMAAGRAPTVGERLRSVLGAMEQAAAEGAGDGTAIRSAYESFSEVVARMADRQSGLCRLLDPVLHALGQVSACRA